MANWLQCRQKRTPKSCWRISWSMWKKGVFIITSSFMREALEYNPSNVKIAKIDVKRLADLMKTYNLGVSTKVLYEIKKLDTDYFDE